MKILPASLRPGLSLAALALAVLLPASASAQESSTLWPRFALEAGPYLATTDVTVRVDDGDVLGTTLRFEEDLGADPEATVASVRLELLAGRRHGFSLSYYEVDQSAARSIDRSITFDGFTYPVGAEGEGEFRAAQLELAYTLWLVREERGGLGVTLGVVGMDAEARAGARVRIGDFMREESVYGETTAPVPGIGLEGRALVGSHVIASGRFRYLPEVTVDNYTGTFLTAGAGLEWRVLRNFGVALTYEHLDLDLELDDPSWRGKLDFTTSGPRLVGRLVF